MSTVNLDLSLLERVSHNLCIPCWEENKRVNCFHHIKQLTQHLRNDHNCSDQEITKIKARLGKFSSFVDTGLVKAWVIAETKKRRVRL